VREDAARFGDARRTHIEEAERITISMVETVTDEPVTVILSRNGFIRTRQGHGIERATLTWKEADGPLAIVETRTVHPIVLFGANGRVFNLRATELPGGKGDGVPVSSLVDTQGTAIVGLVSGVPETAVLMATASGNALRAKLENLVVRQRAGKQFMTVDEGDAQLHPSVIPAEAKEVAALSGEGRLLVFPLEEVKELPSGGRGVKAMSLHEGEPMLGLRPVAGELRIAAAGRSDKRISIALDNKALAHARGARARSGRKLQPYFKKIDGFD
jgi:topoisomerase-4 subunit A